MDTNLFCWERMITMFDPHGRWVTVAAKFCLHPALVRKWHFFCCKVHIKFRHCVWKFIKTLTLYLQMQRGTLDAGALRIGDGESISRSNGIEFSIFRCYWIQNLRQEKYLVWSWICWWGWNIFDGDMPWSKIGLCITILGDGHQSVNTNLYTHCKESLMMRMTITMRMKMKMMMMLMMMMMRRRSMRMRMRTMTTTLGWP